MQRLCDICSLAQLVKWSGVVAKQLWLWFLFLLLFVVVVVVVVLVILECSLAVANAT